MELSFPEMRKTMERTNLGDKKFKFEFCDVKFKNPIKNPS